MPRRCRKTRCVLEDYKGRPSQKLVFMDESGLNLFMTRTHAWVQKGDEYVERGPRNWGRNLTLVGAMRLSGWVVLNTMFASMNGRLFID